MSTGGKFPIALAIQGNPGNPAYLPLMSNFQRPWTFFNRLWNILETTFLCTMWRQFLVPAVQTQVCTFIFLIMPYNE